MHVDVPEAMDTCELLRSSCHGSSTVGDGKIKNIQSLPSGCFWPRRRERQNHILVENQTYGGGSCNRAPAEVKSSL